MIEAMKQALEALEKISMGGSPEWANDVIPALRQAIDQAEKQELVANRSDCGHKEFMPLCQMCQAMGAQAHSYTAPPMTPEHLPQYIATDGKPMESGGGGVCSRPRKEWVGLTKLEVKHYNNRLSGSNVAQEIESKLRERNT